MTAEHLAWFGILFCISQSAMFSGLNLAFFGISRLQLEVEAETNPKARRVLEMRTDSNFLLTTILWGNVGVNVLLTLLSNSVLTGVAAFFFSTVVITFLGEILPQAYFSRNAVRMASFLAPVLKLYQIFLFPVAKPAAKLLDAWLGKESAEYFRENVIKDMLLKHVEEDGSDVGVVEGLGALNFLEIDDLKVSEEGTPVDPASILQLPTDVDLPRVPEQFSGTDDAFLLQVHASGKKWVVLADPAGNPQLLLDADGFLRAAILEKHPISPYEYCHRPILVTNKDTRLGSIIRQLSKNSTSENGVIENDVVLVWTDQPRISTGADLLDRLLHGI
jgi:metal transporter CNNM